MTTEKGIRLEFSDKRPSLTDVAIAALYQKIYERIKTILYGSIIEMPVSKLNEESKHNSFCYGRQAGEFS